MWKCLTLPKVEKFQAQTCMKLGDTEAAHAHMAEAKRLQQQVAGDAVERVSENGAQPARHRGPEVTGWWLD